MQIQLKQAEEIKYGKPSAESDLDSVITWLVYAFADTGTIKSGGTHRIVKLLALAKDAFDAILSGSPDFDNATSTSEQGCYNLGRLMHMKLQGYDLTRVLNQIKVEMGRKISGGTASTTTATDILANFWFLIGHDDADLIGDWYNPKWVGENEAIAGIWMIVFYICKIYNLHCITYAHLIRGVGRFSDSEGVIKGIFQPLVDCDEKTWGSVLVKEENTNAVDVFGVQIDMVDDELLKGILVPKIAGIETISNKLLSRSRWVWRYGKWIDVQPLYFMWTPDDGDIVPFEDWDDSTQGVQLFKDYTDTQWAWFNSELNQFLNRLKGFYFKNKAFANCKSQITFVRLLDMPPLPQGNGGILAHQYTAEIDDELDDDDLIIKFGLEVTGDGKGNALCIRRATNNNNRILAIGEMTTPEDVRIMHGLSATYVTHAGTDGALYRLPEILPRSFIGVGVIKTEDEDYRIGRTIKDLDAGDFDSSVHAPKVWEESAGGLTDEWPTSVEYAKNIYYYGRSSDPYKKLKHMVFDVNELDVDLVIKSVKNFLFGRGNVETTPIAVSAITENPDKSLENRTSATEIPAAQPISATPVSAVAEKKDEKKDKKEEKK